MAVMQGASISPRRFVLQTRYPLLVRLILDDLLAPQNIKAETRMAITTHESADVGVCITNRLSSGKRTNPHTGPLKMFSS